MSRPNLEKVCCDPEERAKFLKTHSYDASPVTQNSPPKDCFRGKESTNTCSIISDDVYLPNSTQQLGVSEANLRGTTDSSEASLLSDEPDIKNNCFAGGGSITDISPRAEGHPTSKEQSRHYSEEPQAADLYLNGTCVDYNETNNRHGGCTGLIQKLSDRGDRECIENDYICLKNFKDSTDTNYLPFERNNLKCQRKEVHKEDKIKDSFRKSPSPLRYPWKHVRRRRKLRLMFMAGFYVISISCVSLYREVVNGTDQSDHLTGEEPSGSLEHRVIREASPASNKTKCKESNRGVMPPDFLSEEMAKNGGWVLHLFIGSYMFAAVASVCDIYFVPSLEHISEDLDLQADVAGATFMAAASSAPEFCTSVITTLLAKSDAGLGAIVGSSIFNLLVIVGACAIFAGMPVQLTWYPLTRDTIFYTLSVVLMAVFMYDNLIVWYEATMMIVAYVLYIVVMVFNKRLERWSILKMKSCRKPTTTAIIEEEETVTNRLVMMDARRHSRICTQDTLTKSGIREMERLTVTSMTEAKEFLAKTARSYISETLVNKISSVYNKVEMIDFPVLSPVSGQPGTSIDPVPANQPEAVEQVLVQDETEEDKVAISEYTNPLAFPKGFISRCYYIFILPATLLHALTIPDSRRLGTWQSKVYLISFTLSVIYIGGYSYVMVWMITMAGNAWGIPETITGLTVLAAGTSVPDLLSSVFVARDGYGDMAVSNAIGSNVFDILLCLGIPWLIDNLSISKNGTVIDSEGMVFAVLTLFLTIAYLWGSMKCFNWTLTPVYGFVTIMVYIVIISFCILLETNVLFRGRDESHCNTG